VHDLAEVRVVAHHQHPAVVVERRHEPEGVVAVEARATQTSLRRNTAR
jgi:hypothetical protein